MLHQFFIKTPWWARAVFSDYVWRMPGNERKVYLTFDDGPHPSITPWVLNQLKEYDASATFFCIGDNVRKFPETYQSIIAAGHSVGNHTQQHLNGWTTSVETYLGNVAEASKLIKSNLFRPPYGKIKNRQAKGLMNAVNDDAIKVIMWDVLSADFDVKTSAKKCLQNVTENVSAGSIIVFHDSEKAFRNLETVLPQALKILHGESYRFGKIPMKGL